MVFRKVLLFQKYDFLIEDIKTEKLPEIIKNIFAIIRIIHSISSSNTILKTHFIIPEEPAPPLRIHTHHPSAHIKRSATGTTN